MAQHFEDQQRALALSLSSSGVTFKSPQNAFNGKRVCDAQEGITGLVAGPNGDGDFHHGDDRATCWWFWGDSCFSRGSYHPNKLGTTTYANASMQMGPSLTARQRRP
ncbi:hypothetical protein [Streptomyces sp. NPDC058476]|uniref:hypothetical protein n=1 Tax=Streptomyces sp. NPDC058476 TaxID=3346519 RepID=UPI0036622D80